jgi:hypothetical protein
MLSALNQLMQRVAKKVVKGRPVYDKAYARIVEFEDEIIKINQEMDTDIAKEGDNITAHYPSSRKSLKYSDPPVSQCKGKRKAQRLKSPAEVKDAKKMRTCGYYHKKWPQYS